MTLFKWVKGNKSKVVRIPAREFINLHVIGPATLAQVLDEKSGYKTRLLKAWIDLYRLEYCYEVEPYKELK